MGGGGRLWSFHCGVLVPSPHPSLNCTHRERIPVRRTPPLAGWGWCRRPPRRPPLCPAAVLLPLHRARDWRACEPSLIDVAVRAARSGVQPRPPWSARSAGWRVHAAAHRPRGRRRRTAPPRPAASTVKRCCCLPRSRRLAAWPAAR